MLQNNINQKDLKSRHKIEEKFHDEKAIKGVDDFYKFGALEQADEYCWVALGTLKNKRILEIGCGEGLVSVRFAKAGAFVTCIDISGEMIELTKQRATQNGVKHKIKALHMSGEEISFPDHSFDIIYGHSILHHLNLDITNEQLTRLLKPDGFAVFLEPLDYNPILNTFRRFTPHRRTPTERPLRFEQLESIAKHFSSWEHDEFYLLSLVSFFWYYGLKNEKLFRITQKLFSYIDSFLFKVIPYLKKYAWVSVIKFKK